jgi:hypothetical protein
MALSKSPHRASACRSTWTSQSTTQKHAKSSQPSPLQHKRACTTILAPCRPTKRLVSTLPQPRQPIEVLNEDEDKDKDKDIASSVVQDNNAEVTQLRELQNKVRLQDKVRLQNEVEEDIMKYTSIWKAIVNSKENLSSRSAIYIDNKLYIYMIRQWQDEVIEKAQPQQLTIVKLETVVSFDCC